MNGVGYNVIPGREVAERGWKRLGAGITWRNEMVFSMLTALIVLGMAAAPAFSTSPTQTALPKGEPPSSSGAGSGPPPRTIEQWHHRLGARLDRAAEAADLVIRASSFYHRAEVLIQAGRRADAHLQLERARAILEEARPALRDEPMLQRFAHQLEARLAAWTPRPETAARPWAFDHGAGSPVGAKEAEWRINAALIQFQTRYRELVQRAFIRLQPIRRVMERILRQEGIPAEFIAVGLVESAYDPQAESRAGAKGIWQFVELTARRYGLIHRGRGDRREELTASTRAAARYLRDLHRRWGDWLLALAAYNAGEGRVERAIRAAGTRDFWELARRQALPPETIDYVPRVLAAIRILKRPRAYGFAAVDVDRREVVTGRRHRDDAPRTDRAPTDLHSGRDERR
ncbi:MAG: hypothetical protein D6723_03695 [Acidobacteria bacterium]|nr:MAG: hypothetical protein D6723_03695 [Acidobacteriota bacterium]